MENENLYNQIVKSNYKYFNPYNGLYNELENNLKLLDHKKNFKDYDLIFLNQIHHDRHKRIRIFSYSLDVY